MNYAGFIPGGICIALAGIALFGINPRGVLSALGSLFVVVFGLGMAASGIFSCDVGCPGSGSAQNNIHMLLGPVTFLPAILAPIFLGLSFRRTDNFRKISWYSLLSGAAALLLMATMIRSVGSEGPKGLWQRLILLTVFAWLIVTSTQARRAT